MTHGRSAITLGLALATLVGTDAYANCTKASGKVLRGASGDATLVLIAGGTAEYTTSNGCTVLTFTAVRDGKAFYTDDGLGRGLAVLVSGGAFDLVGARAVSSR